MSPQHSRRLIAAALLLLVLAGACAPMVRNSIASWGDTLGVTCSPDSFCWAAKHGYMH